MARADIAVRVSLNPPSPFVFPLWLGVGGTEIQFRYGHWTNDWLCILFANRDAYLNPSETTHGFIGFLSPEAHHQQFWVGMPFVLAFGQRIVAHGHIESVIDPLMIKHGHD